MNNFHNRYALPFAACCLFALTAVGAVAKGDKAAYDQAHATAKSEYAAESKQCDALAGNAKDVCIAQAKLHRTTTEEQAKAAYENTPAAQESAADAIAKSQHNLAKEKCDDLGANPKDVCVKEADAAYTKAKADAKAARKMGDAHHDAAVDKRDADYKVATEKCDALAGDAKTNCVNQAKAAYGK